MCGDVSISEIKLLLPVIQLYAFGLKSLSSRAFLLTMKNQLQEVRDYVLIPNYRRETEWPESNVCYLF